MHELKFDVVDGHKAPYWLKVAPDFKISTRHYPNAWRRFWTWALLGWTWENPQN